MPRDPELVPWGPSRLPALVALCEAALPNEQLDEDTIEACCFAEGALVVGADDGSAAVCVAPGNEPSTWHVQVVVVVPSRQGLGRGRALVAAARETVAAQGAARLVLGGLAAEGRYLWPGVDVRALRVLALAEACGVAWTETVINLACASTVRAPVPAGVAIERVLEEPCVDRVVTWVGQRWPAWQPEVARAVEHGTCLVAVDADEPLGFACHSVNRPGWFGPTAVEPAARGLGIGAALLGEACRDLMAAGHREVEIAWVGPLAFYARVAGAAVSRVFRTGWLSVPGQPTRCSSRSSR